MKKAFTLVELLAVIVILAIILAIAIPSASSMINSSRLNSFNISSEMLEKVARTYVNVNNITVGLGTTTEILYSDVKNAGYINRIVDPISNNECTHSRVYVTNVGGTYTYKGALACDNYMDIDVYNLVTNGDFSSSTNGWTGGASGYLSVTSNILTNTGNGGMNSQISEQLSVGAYSSGKNLYARVKARVTNSNTTFIKLGTWASGMGTLYYQILTNPIQNQWYTLSGIVALSSGGSGNYDIETHAMYADAATENGKIMQIDGSYGLYVLDLTSIYGAGNEPTKTQMDNIMTNMGK